MTTDRTPTGISLIQAPERGIWRLGKANEPLKYDTISRQVASGSGGKPWSMASYGTLYCATDQEGCYAEALAPFRLHPTTLRDAVEDWKDPSYMPPGRLPRDWSTRRILVRLQPVKEARFLDVDDEETLEALSRELRQELAALGVSRLTTADIQGFNPRVTRRISAWAITQRTGPSEQERLIHGIAYRSRLGLRQCWAVFGDVELKQVESSLVFPEAEALREVADECGLRML
ncbi:RES domain-containing protein [Streptomyces sp. NPDC057939]|uniref:RES domain-containing protein n=1 Tax=Streptomyces sp. NPDC057939 TaxID=3346284 RepID=UPI0036EC88FF